MCGRSLTICSLTVPAVRLVMKVSEEDVARVTQLVRQKAENSFTPLFHRIKQKANR